MRWPSQRTGAHTILDVSDAPPGVVEVLFPAHWPADGNRLLGGIAPDGRLAVTCAGATVSVHRETDGRSAQTDELQHAGFTVMGLSPDGTRLAAAEGDNHIQLWDVSRTPAVPLCSAPAATRIQNITISPEGRYAGVAGFNGRAIYDLTAAHPEQIEGATVMAHNDGRWSFNVDPPLAAFGGDAILDLRQTPAAPISRPLQFDNFAFVPGRSELLSWSSPTGDVQFQWTPWHIDRAARCCGNPRGRPRPILPPIVDPSDIRWGSRPVPGDGGQHRPVERLRLSTHQRACRHSAGASSSTMWKCLSSSGDLVLVWMTAPDTTVWDLTTTPPTEYRVPVFSTAGALCPTTNTSCCRRRTAGLSCTTGS